MSSHYVNQRRAHRFQRKRCAVVRAERASGGRPYDAARSAAVDAIRYNRAVRILISGGGTGGHIYPALAVARELRDSYGAELLYIGDRNGLETEIVPRAGIPFDAISAGKLRKYLSARTFSDLGRIPLGMMQALGHVRR